jgi:hypothetical protein
MLPAESSSNKAGGTGEGNDEFVNTSKGFLTRCEMLLHGTDGLTSPPKEGLLRIFIALGLI